jgi:glycosyltransferase involved in cell wall biosynthesis
MPFLSIITPLHNKEGYIAETIESVLTQSFPDWEMIVVENHSVDDGPQIAQDYAKRDSRIRYFHAPPEVRGPGAARNCGLENAAGEWVLFLDADDLLLPGHFEKLVQSTRKKPSATLISCDWLRGPTIEQSEQQHPTNWTPGCDFVSSAIGFTPWVPHGAIVRKTALGEYPWWNESLDRLIAEDYPFWFKILLQADAAYSNHVGVFYRDETTGRRNSEENLEKYLESVDRGIQENLDLLIKRGIPLNFNHRRSLFQLNLGLIRFSFSANNAWLEQRIRSRIRDLRPSFVEAVRKRDSAVALSYLMPLKWLRRLVEWKRAKARKAQ